MKDNIYYIKIIEKWRFVHARIEGDMGYASVRQQPNTQNLKKYI